MVLLGSAATALSTAAGVAMATADRRHDVRPVGSLTTLQPRLAPLPDVTPGPIIEGSFASRFRRGERTGWSIAVPPDTDPSGLPVVVALHGVHGNHAWVNGPRIGMPQFLAAAVAAGVPPFAVAAVDGGTTYWHPHDGVDSGAMVRREFLPLLRDHGLDTGRLALMGWSMGGYGALRLAGLMGPDRITAVAASSPALWINPRRASPWGFDSAREYLRYSIMHDQRSLLGIPVRIDVGFGDRFHDAVVVYAAGFPRRAHLTFRQHEGAHTVDFWRRRLPTQLRFLSHSLHA